MGFIHETLVARMRNRLATSTEEFARRHADKVRRAIAARKIRAAQDREFYRNLKAYCLANHVSPVCEDDWKTSA